MVPRWKKLSIRVFVAARESFDGTTQSTSSEEECGTDLEGNTIYSNQRYTLLLRTYVDSNWVFFSFLQMGSYIHVPKLKPTQSN